MAEQKIRIGKGKKKKDGWLQATISEKALRTLLDDHLQEFNGNKFVRVNINVLKEPDQYGKDVEITLDTWKPNYTVPKEEPQQVDTQTGEIFNDQTPLPF